MSVSADRRHLEGVRDPDGERLARAEAAVYLGSRLRLAKLLVRIDRAGAYVYSGCSSIVQYGVQLGVPTAEARLLVDLGRTLVEPPLPRAPDTSSSAPAPPAQTADERLRTGKLHVENAALVGQLLARPGLIRPGEDWLRKAETTPTPVLRRLVQNRIEMAAQGDVVVPITVQVRQTVREGFARARVLASRDAGVMLTDGQTFSLLVRRYLASEDRLERLQRPGRKTGTIRHDRRYIAASVRDSIRGRACDRCEVPGCSHTTFLEFAHLRPHSAGGSRDADNLVLLCHEHHVLLDAGVLRFAGWRDGRPTFRTADGGTVTRAPVIAAPDGVGAGGTATAIDVFAAEDDGGPEGARRGFERPAETLAPYPQSGGGEGTVAERSPPWRRTVRTCTTPSRRASAVTPRAPERRTDRVDGSQWNSVEARRARSPP